MAAPGNYEDVARVLDYPLLHPQLTDEQVVEGLQSARHYGIASAVVRSCDIDLAVRTLQGSAVRPAAVCSYPHGTQNTAIKLYEARDLLRRGAKEIEMVLGVPKLVSREFQYVQTELLQMSDLCHKEGAVLKVIIESPWLTDELKIIACRCCERAEVDFVVTGTGTVANESWLNDVRLVRKYLPEEAAVKAACGTGGLDDVLMALDAGATRIGTESMAEILEEWKRRIAPPAASSA